MLLLCTSLFPGSLLGQTPDARKVIAAAEKVVKEAAAASPAPAPGCAVGVSLDGKPVFEKAFGTAELEHNVTITTNSIFESGSVAKQFTAASLVLLAIDGKLSIDDPVRKYIPELPDYGAPLTIRHLLNHTAGVRDWGAVMELTGVGRGERIVRQDLAMYVTTRQKNLDFTPGAEYSYSNSGYTLASTIVERVSGKSLPEFTKERIFDPIGMTSTSWRDDFERLVPGRVQAYNGPPAGPWKLQMPFMNVYGNGGILTTIGDFLKWNAALSSGEWQTMVDMLETQGVLNDGRKINYALGLVVGDYQGIREVGHGGRTAGYVTYLARYPELNLSTAVLCNAPSNNPTAITHKIIDEIAGPFPPAPEIETSEMSLDQLKRFEGLWRHDKTHMPFRTVVDKERKALTDGRAVFRPLLDGSFQTGIVRWTFEFDSKGRRTAAVRNAGGEIERFIAEDQWTPSEADLIEMTGRWYSEEAQATFELKIDGGKLALVQAPSRRIALTALYKDHFTPAEGSGIVTWFTRDAKGRIEKLHVGTSRMRDMPFER